MGIGGRVRRRQLASKPTGDALSNPLNCGTNRFRYTVSLPASFLARRPEFLGESVSVIPIRDDTLKACRIDKTSRRHWSKPVKLHGNLLYLISDTSSYVSGVVISIDGGVNANPPI